MALDLARPRRGALGGWLDVDALLALSLGALALLVGSLGRSSGADGIEAIDGRGLPGWAAAVGACVATLGV